MNLKGVTSLLLDSDVFSRGLITSMLRGFGMEPPVIGQKGADAMAYLQNHCVDLCVIEAMLPDMTGAEFIRWVRRPEMGAVRFMPVIVLSSYTQLRLVADARDGGAHIIVRKPLSPQGLFDRIAWVARAQRPFIDGAAYAGPDRRFRVADPSTYRPKRAGDARDPAGLSAQATSKFPNRLAAAVVKGSIS
jgi:DNA-binding response OmpR family regulator